MFGRSLRSWSVSAGSSSPITYFRVSLKSIVTSRGAIGKISRSSDCAIGQFLSEKCLGQTATLRGRRGKALARPLLYATYCRPWFLDHLNYGKSNSKQKPL